MKKISKNRKKIEKEFDISKKYDPMEAIKLLKKNSYVKFNETLDISIKLSMDASKSDQNIRAVTNLPHGTGKNIKVAVMAKEEKLKEAQEAGADIVGEINLNEDIQKGKIDFDLLIATPDMMANIGKLGKILGPKGLMPNPKLGTVTNDISSAVKKAKSGQVQFKNDKSGIIHAGIGKLKFKEEALFENLKAFYNEVLKNRPETIKGSKGSYIKKIFITSTMGFGLEINLGGLK
tara:strand:- start:240 stop:941 length:702 start_codon:yes stop_codon:yes gene_type:complete